MLKPCVLGADWHTAKVRGFIWGDSNSQHLYHLLHPVAAREGIAIATIFPCPAVVDIDHLRYDAPTMPIYNQSCTTIRHRLLEYLQKSPDIGLVILAASWTTLPWNVASPANEKRSPAGGIKLIGDALDRLLPQLERPGRRVILFADFPNIVPSYAMGRSEKLTDPVACVLATSKLLRRPCDLDQEAWRNFEQYGLPVHTALRQALARHPGVVGHFPEDYLCEPGKCRTWLGDEFLYRDSNHIRRNLRPATVEAFDELLKIKQMLTGAE